MFVEKVSDKILEVFEIMKESVKINSDSEEEIERIEKIKEYIEQNKN